ncbi:MAG: PBP1A family penicillin-binding protein [Peptococcaceae bacterium]|jgi:penicillin-binding protein 1A|nr:PBP1A family penicillin-binding protein [Peptococcaceae bacterium]
MTKKKSRVVKQIVKLIFILILFACFVGAGAAGGYVLSCVWSLPAYNLDSLTGDMTTVIYDSQEQQVGVFKAEQNRLPLEPNEIPTVVKQAFIAIEDQRFESHIGVDPIRLVGAIIINIRDGFGAQGASTITQQLARTAVLHSQEVTLKRKIQEAYIAIQLEKKYHKSQILAYFLNSIYYGEGCYSLQTAADTYFGKKAKDLTLPEAAMLAAVINGPSLYSPYTKPENAKGRQALVLDEMVSMGYITRSQAEEAKNTPLELKERNTSGSSGGANYQYQSYMDYVLEEASSILELSGSDIRSLYTGGYQIYTALDSKTQALAEELYSDEANFPKPRTSDDKIIQSAAIIINQLNGEIQTIIGGRDIQGERQFNRAIDALRQPGSSFKPIVVYGPALEMGYGPGSVFDDFPDGFTTTDHKFINVTPVYRGLVTLRTAVRESINTVAVKVLEQIGIPNGVQFAKNLGITSLVESGSKIDIVPSLALGGITKGVSPVQMAAAYGSFGNQGIYNKPHVIRRILDYSGNIIYEGNPEKRMVMTPQTAYLMTDMLMTAVESGTGTRARLTGRETAGKTGTTSENVDAWFVGFTANLTAAVWMGYDMEDNMGNVYGGTYCAPLWKKLMDAAHEDIPAASFVRPDGLVDVVIDSKSGLLPSELTPDGYKVTEKFNRSFVPEEISSVWVQAPVCSESGQLLTDNCPSPEIKTFLQRAVPWVGAIAPDDSGLEVPTAYCAIHGAGAIGLEPGDQPPFGPDASGQFRLFGRLQGDADPPVAGLTWYFSQATRDTTYHIYRAASSDAAPVRLAVLESTQVSYDDSAMEDGTAYIYIIQAINKTSGEMEAVSNEIKIQTPSKLPPMDMPYLNGVIMSGLDGSTPYVNLSWTAASPDRPIIYYVHRSGQAEFIPDENNKISGEVVASLSWSDYTVQRDQIYYYRVTGVDAQTGEAVPLSTRVQVSINP